MDRPSRLTPPSSSGPRSTHLPAPLADEKRESGERCGRIWVGLAGLLLDPVHGMTVPGPRRGSGRAAPAAAERVEAPRPSARGRQVEEYERVDRRQRSLVEDRPEALRG